MIAQTYTKEKPLLAWTNGFKGLGCSCSRATRSYAALRPARGVVRINPGAGILGWFSLIGFPHADDVPIKVLDSVGDGAWMRRDACFFDMIISSGLFVRLSG
jgi:hypothetical protein